MVMVYEDVYEQLLARSYDDLYRTLRDPSGDVAFYVGLAREIGGPVLELGCGTGRVLLPIAATGIACVGLDASPAMLDVLRGKQPPPNLELVQGRMETFALGDARFRLTISPFRALQHLLDVDSQLAALANVRRHLVAGGAFAFDVFDPKLDRIAVADEAEHLAATFTQDGRQNPPLGRRAPRPDDAGDACEVPLRGGRRRSGRDRGDAALVLPLRARAPARPRRLHRRHVLRRLRPPPLARRG